MSFQFLSLILGGILSLADYVTEHTIPKSASSNHKLVSFSAGVAVSYIILSLFPEISSYALIDGKQIFIYALLGFVILNLIEQYVYKGVGKLKNLPKYHKKVRIAYFFVYNLFVGVVLVSFASRGLAQTILFFIAFFLYMVVEMIPQGFEFQSKILGAFYSISPLIGTLIGAYYIDYTDPLFGKLTSFVTGTLLYIVIREFLPTDKAEKPFYFTVGVIFYALVILLSWRFI